MYIVYALYDRKRNRFYIGSTNNLYRREKEHKAGKTFTTAGMNTIELVYYEACISKQDAVRREKQLKTGFGRGYLRNRIADFLKNYINTPG